MAARRLIIAMVVLLCVSTAIAILAPNPKLRDDQIVPVTSGASGATGGTGASGETGTSGPEEAVPDRSKTVVAKVQPREQGAEVRASPGDRLILSVETARPDVVEIVGLGLADAASKYEPARFDILLPPSGDAYEVISAGNQEVLARIVAKQAGEPEKTAMPKEPAKAEKTEEPKVSG